jgi:hypothetical protein
MGMQIHARKKLSTVNNHASILERDMFLGLSWISSWLSYTYICAIVQTVGKIHLNNCSHYHLPLTLSLCHLYSHPNSVLSYIFILRVAYVQKYVCHLHMKLQIFMTWTNKHCVNCAWLHRRYKKGLCVIHCMNSSRTWTEANCILTWWGR